VHFCRCELDANLIRVAPECRDTTGLPVCIMALLANGHAFRSDKRVYENKMLGIGVP
jgi:hypothetical protein